MAETKIRVERLYLAKEPDCTIYVDTKCLIQHQYDGIRFLYRQYKKGKPGVILNDPPGYGKRVQTVLFLSAMRHVMTLPALVLCTEGKEEVWTQLFHQWTDMGADVVIQKDNEYTKSMFVICTLPQVNLLCRREWGMLVVDDTNVSKEALRAAINAKYKIWLTSLDMKIHLQTFSLLYEYLYPKDKFNIEHFKAESNKPSAVFTASIKLDAFMEDIVVRRRDAEKPFGRPDDIPNDLQVSRKNKDATGRKIKRSKPDNKGDAHKKYESIEEFVVNIENNPTGDPIQKSDSQDCFNGDFIDSENIVIRYDSGTEDDETEYDIPVKKSKIINDNKVSEDLFSSDNVLSDKSENNHDINNENNDFIDSDDILTQAY